ncbi:MAG: cupin domain-containing protein [Chitinophagaceae bacterium]|nr:cupin domain-containing protein [Chitinophagaceae bacterium]
MQHLNEIQPKQIASGILGKYIHGAGATLGYVYIKAGSILPPHHHVHEQITFIVEGELEMKIGDQTYLLTEGTAHVIPSNMPHSATALIDCIVIDVFSPTREDYK